MSLTLSAETSAAQTTKKTLENQSDYSGNALLTLHRALTRLRTLVYEGTEPVTLGRMLDDIEYLGSWQCRAAQTTAKSMLKVFACTYRTWKLNIKASVT